MANKKEPMSHEAKNALLKYTEILKKDGRDAAEKFIQDNESKYPGFRKWAHALRFMVRVGKIRRKEGYEGDG